MLQDKNSIYLNWITGSFEGRHINILKLNKNLDKISEEKMPGVDSSEQISENILLLGYKDRIEVIDMNTSINTSVPAEKPSLIAGTLTDKGYLITYYENKANFKCFFVKDDEASEPKIIGRYIMGSKSSFGKVAVSSDNKYGYSLIEIKNNKKGVNSIYLMKFSLNDKEGLIHSRSLRISGVSLMFGPVAVSSGSEARFLISGYRNYIKSRYQTDIIDFTLKDGDIESYNYLSRTQELGMYPASNGKYAVFCDNTGETSFDIFLTSLDEEFKKYNNGIIKADVKRSISEVIGGYCGTVTMYIAIGGIWVIVGATLISLFSLNSFKFDVKTNKLLFVICCIATAAVKVYTIYFFYYKSNYVKPFLPEFLKSAAIGLALVSLISFVCYLDGYLKFSNKLKSEYAIPFFSFGGVTLLDTMLSLMIFQPFISN